MIQDYEMYERTRELFREYAAVPASGLTEESAKKAMDLINQGVDIYALDPDKFDRHRYTLLIRAIMAGHTAGALKLILAGADVNAPILGGKTPLHVAIEKECDEIVRILLDHHAHIHSRDQHGGTPLHAAAAEDDEYHQNMLLERGANIWAMNKNRFRPESHVLDAVIDKFIADLEESPGRYPQSLPELMRFVSIMIEVNDAHPLPEPRQLAQQLFTTLPHNDTLNALYQEYFGHPRPPKTAASLQEMRRNAQGRGAVL